MICSIKGCAREPPIVAQGAGAVFVALDSTLETGSAIPMMLALKQERRTG